MKLMSLKQYSPRLAAALSAVLIAQAGFLSVPCFAKHKPPTVAPGDPCAKMSRNLSLRISDMRTLKKEIAKEQSTPDTVAKVFDLLQGRAYNDQPKSQKLAEMRSEADTINNAMKATGCAPVNIDAELAKVAPPTLPAATRKGSADSISWPAEISRRSTP